MQFAATFATRFFGVKTLFTLKLDSCSSGGVWFDDADSEGDELLDVGKSGALLLPAPSIKTSDGADFDSLVRSTISTLLSFDSFE